MSSAVFSVLFGVPIAISKHTNFVLASTNFYNRMLMRITECYIMIGGATFLNDHAIILQSMLCNVIGKVSPRGVAYVSLVLEALLRSFPTEGGTLLLQCGILKRMLMACADSWFEAKDCEPDKVIVLYFTALARVLLTAPGLLQSLLPVTLASGALFGEAEMVSLYLKKFQVAGNGAHGLLFQQLWAMLLLSYYPPCEVPSYSSILLGASNEVFSLFTYVLRNVNADGSNLLSYEVGYDEEEETVEIGADIYEALLQGERQKDIVLKMDFRRCISTKIGGLRAVLGEATYNQFLSSIDTSTMAQLEELLTNRG